MKADKSFTLRQRAPVLERIFILLGLILGIKTPLCVILESVGFNE